MMTKHQMLIDVMGLVEREEELGKGGFLDAV